MKTTKAKKHSAKMIGFYLLLIFILLIVIFPIYWMVLTSVQPRDELMSSPPIFFTTRPTLEHWKFIINLKLPPLKNSFVVASVSTIIAIVVSSLSGYAFARYRVGGSSLPFWILSIKFLPPIVAAIPFFLLMNYLKLIDTLTGLIIPHLTITIPFAVWMIMSFIKDVPKELEESAMIDGCSAIGVIWKITLPLIMPGIAVTALFCFVYSWNDFLFALILTRARVVTLPVAIAGMREAHGLMWGSVSAMATMATLPILVLAMVLQKYLVRGLALGAVRG